jgi:hypothetical protein
MIASKGKSNKIQQQQICASISAEWVVLVTAVIYVSSTGRYDPPDLTFPKNGSTLCYTVMHLH